MNEVSQSNPHLERFRQALPGLKVKALSEKIHQLAMDEVNRWRAEGKEPPLVPTPESLRVMLFYGQESILRPETHAFLEPILETVFEGLQNSPGYLDGRVPVDLHQLDQLVEWLKTKMRFKLRHVLGADLASAMSASQVKAAKAAPKKQKAPYITLPQLEFEDLLTSLSAAVEKAQNASFTGSQ